MTVAGAVIGTLAYMAPEQARGEAVDQRADVYAFGLILRDMLLGGRRAGATTAFAELMARMLESPLPMRTLDATIPEALDALVTRCLQPDPANRYQTERGAARGPRSRRGERRACRDGHRSRRRAPLGQGRPRPAARGDCGGRVLLLGGGRRSASGSGTARPAARPPRACRPGRPSRWRCSRSGTRPATRRSIPLGTSLSEVLATDLGEASHVRTIPSVRLREVLRDLRSTRTRTSSPADLARIADFASAQTILWGQYVKFGDEIRIDATLQDLEQQKTTPAQGDSGQPGGHCSPPSRSSPSRSSRRSPPVRRRPERAEGVGVAALHAVVRGAAPLQRRAAALAGRQPSDAR